MRGRPASGSAPGRAPGKEGAEGGAGGGSRYGGGRGGLRLWPPLGSFVGGMADRGLPAPSEGSEAASPAVPGRGGGPEPSPPRGLREEARPRCGASPAGLRPGRRRRVVVWCGVLPCVPIHWSSGEDPCHKGGLSRLGEHFLGGLCERKPSGGGKPPGTFQFLYVFLK